MAKKRRPEPTQSGNPYQLRVNQHIHSRACIERFADGRGRIFVTRRGAKPFTTAPDNGIFCAPRVWDQGSEASFFKRIEDAFQVEVDCIIATGTVGDHDAVSAYLAVWGIRAKLAADPPEALVLNGLEPDPYLTKDQEERLEQKHTGYARGNVVPGHLAGWLTIRYWFDTATHRLKGRRWGVLHAPNGHHFISADIPDGLAYIPLSPSVALAADFEDIQITPESVARANNQAIEVAERFIFGHPEDMHSHTLAARAPDGGGPAPSDGG